MPFCTGDMDQTEYPGVNVTSEGFLKVGVFRREAEWQGSWWCQGKSGCTVMRLSKGRAVSADGAEHDVGCSWQKIWKIEQYDIYRQMNVCEFDRSSLKI